MSLQEAVWAEETASPHRVEVEEGVPFCAEPDAALLGVAQRIAAREASGSATDDAATLTGELRAQGDPHVWPHAWITTVTEEHIDERLDELRALLDSLPRAGVQRCGVASTRSRESTISVAAVWVDAVANLSPVPARARSGEWISFDATLLVPATRAKLFVLTPKGRAFAVPTTLRDGRARARFVVDMPGKWSAQLVATVEGGPRPVLEAPVFVEMTPRSAASEEVPGQGSVGIDRDPAAWLSLLLDALRRAKSLPPLRRNAALDALATRHAEAMRSAGRLGHVSGAGDPADRLRELGVETTVVGENVAHDATVPGAHRALWASVSHRVNLIDPRFDTVGVGASRDTDGSLWVSQIFAKLP